MNLKEQILVVGDIAGRYNELVQLSELAKEQFGDFSLVSVGDICDRGKDTKKVIQAFIDNPDWFSIKGNHEDMMVDWCMTPSGQVPKYNENFRWEVWLGNGGGDTLRSYMEEAPTDDSEYAMWLAERQGEANDFVRELKLNVPSAHIRYLRECPLFIDHTDSFGRFVVTHGPINPVWGLEKCASVDQKNDMSLCWNRGSPKRIEGVRMQFHGHNAGRGVEWHSDSLGKFGCNMDTSRGKILTGVLWPTFEIVQVPYEETVDKPAFEENNEEW